jgi:hypothetical protein
MLIENPRGNFHFLKGIVAYSSGVAADAGHEIVHATLRTPAPVRAGFEFIARHLQQAGRPMHAVCAIELRSPRQFTFEGFAAFNSNTYRALLDEHDMLVDGINPIARTNVVPELGPPPEPSLFAFSYTAPARAAAARRDFVVAGAGELYEDELDPRRIVRAGETSDAAMREKAAYVMQRMALRLQALGAHWDDVSVVSIYTAFDVFPWLRDEMLATIGGARAHGVRWHYTRPPIVGLEYEMDVRGVSSEIYL